MPKSSLKHETCLLVEHETNGKETAQMARTQFTDRYQLKKSSKKIQQRWLSVAAIGLLVTM